MKHNVRQTWDFVRSITEANDVGTVRAVLKQLSAQYGMETTFGGVIPKDFKAAGDLAKSILVADVPVEWTARYLRYGYVHKDPVLQHRTPDRHFTWNDAYRDALDRDQAKLIEGEARSFGLDEGFVVPIHMLDGNTALMSFGGKSIEMSPDDKSALAFATNFAVGQMIYQSWLPEGELRSLSAREVDCLMWAAEGKTDWEISVILGIGAFTVEKHMLSARTKLNAMNKAHAIAKAMRFRIIA